MTSGVYDVFKQGILTEKHLVGSDDFRIALYLSGHSFTATDTDYTTTNEVAEAAPGYDRGTQPLANEAVFSDNAPVIAFNADDISWTTATFTAAHAVIWNNTILGVNDLVCSIDFGGDKSVAVGTFTIQFHATGIVTFT